MSRPNRKFAAGLFSFAVLCAPLVCSTGTSGAGSEFDATEDSRATAKIAAIKQLIAGRVAHFNWRLHEELRVLYVQADMPEDALKECDEMLQHKPFDTTIVTFLSGGEIAKNKQKAISLLLATAQKHDWLTCVVGQCYLTAADLYAEMGQTAEADKCYGLALKDNFVGTENYRAAARIGMQMLQVGMNPCIPAQKIDMCLRNISHGRGAGNFENRELLRGLYHQVGKEAESMALCDQLLTEKPNDEYLVNVLSDWQLDTNKRAALANLMKRAQTYHNLPCVRAACLLAAGDLYVEQKDKASAEKVYKAILQDRSSQVEPYRVVAKVSLDLLDR